MEHATGGFDHLLIATSLPWLLSPGDALLGGLERGGLRRRLGRPGARRLGERVRQALDLEHWAAFRRSFDALAELQRSVGAGERGPAPASIVTLSGDVHHAYLCEVAFPRGVGRRSAVWQAVCSPFRNPLDSHERRRIRGRLVTAARDVGAACSRHAAGVPDPPIRWRMVHDGPFFDNQVATLLIDGRADRHAAREDAAGRRRPRRPRARDGARAAPGLSGWSTLAPCGGRRR